MGYISVQSRFDNGLIIEPDMSFVISSPYTKVKPNNLFSLTHLQECVNLHHIIDNQLTKRKGISCEDIVASGGEVFDNLALLLSSFISLGGGVYLVAVDSAGQLFYKNLAAESPEWTCIVPAFIEPVFRFNSVYYDNHLYIVNGSDILKRFVRDDLEDVAIYHPLTNPMIATMPSGGGIYFNSYLEISSVDTNAMFAGDGCGIWSYKAAFGSDVGDSNPGAMICTPDYTYNSVAMTAACRCNSIDFQFLNKHYLTAVNIANVPVSTSDLVKSRAIFRRWKKYADLPYSAWEKITEVSGNSITTFRDVYASTGLEMEIDNDIPVPSRLIERAGDNIFLANITNDSVLTRPVIPDTLYPALDVEFSHVQEIKVSNLTGKIFTDVLVDVLVRTEASSYTDGILLSDITGRYWQNGVVFLDGDGVTILPQEIFTFGADNLEAWFAVRFPELLPGDNYFYIVYKDDCDVAAINNSDSDLVCKWGQLKSTHKFLFTMTQDKYGISDVTAILNQVGYWENADNPTQNNSMLLCNNAVYINTGTTQGPPFFNDDNMASGETLGTAQDPLLQITAANDYCRAYNLMNTLKEDFTVMLAFYTGGASVNRGLFSIEHDPTHRVWFYVSLGSLRLFVRNGENYTTYSFSLPILNLNKWYFVGFSLSHSNSVCSVYCREQDSGLGSLVQVTLDPDEVPDVNEGTKYYLGGVGGAGEQGYFKYLACENFYFTEDDWDSWSRRCLASNYATVANTGEDAKSYDEEEPKPNRIRWCKSQKPAAYPANYYDDIDSSWGQQITGLKRFKDKIFAMTSNQIAFIPLQGDERSWNTVDSLVDDYAGVGLIAPFSLFEYEDGIGGLSRKGIFIYGERSGFIKGLNYLFDNMTPLERAITEMCYVPETGQLFVQTCTWSGGATPDLPPLSDPCAQGENESTVGIQMWCNGGVVPNRLFVLQLDYFLKTGVEKWTEYDINLRHMLALPTEFGSPMYGMYRTGVDADNLARCFAVNNYYDRLPSVTAISVKLKTLEFDYWQCILQRILFDYKYDEQLSSYLLDLNVYGDGVLKNLSPLSVETGVMRTLPMFRAKSVSFELLDSSLTKLELLSMEHFIEQQLER